MLTGLDGKWTELAVQIQLSEAFRYLGRRGEQTVLTPEILAISREMQDLAVSLAQPRAVGGLYQVVDDGTRLVIGNTLEIAGPRTRRRLGRICQAYLCAVTIGSELEDQVNRYFASTQYTKGAVLDSMGSVAVESLAEQINHSLRQKAHQNGLAAGERISPGYGDWPLEAQFTLFPLTAGGEVGIELTNSGLLRPRKTITALIGIGPMSPDAPSLSGCAECLLADCQFRKT